MKDKDYLINFFLTKPLISELEMTVQWIWLTTKPKMLLKHYTDVHPIKMRTKLFKQLVVTHWQKLWSGQIFSDQNMHLIFQNMQMLNLKII